MIYRFVELETVTATALEQVVNEWVGRGWALDAIRFVVGDGDRRPRMAFVSFFREPVRARHEDIGEIDLGEVEPVAIEMDWENARPARRKRKKS